ncbi:hypothetical protein [Sphingomonas abietis]|uniref:Uncharacterized protein n=1 Tax=Sphingomonas abietis TaxID=3012344 RepID=A0ABY7NQE5_9SPHN|nr:hypothetical protein [Sphingomonas abietis]WBO23417.1 hypothetical protein PBT88_04615 [Sphingomonas abietis]
MNAASKKQAGRGHSRLIGLQAVIACTAMGWLLLAPPAQGQMTLVPLTASAALTLPATVLHGDIRLIGTGPLPGSLLVEGRRADFSGYLLHHATLVLATPPGGCGAESQA